MPDLQFENNDLQTMIKAIPTLAIAFLIFSPVKKAGNLWVVEHSEWENKDNP